MDVTQKVDVEFTSRSNFQFTSKRVISYSVFLESKSIYIYNKYYVTKSKKESFENFFSARCPNSYSNAPWEEFWTISVTI